MTESPPGEGQPRKRGYASSLLILLAVAALALYLLTLSQWHAQGAAAETPAASAMTSVAQSERPGRAPLLPLLAFAIALGAGICVGRFWPRETNRRDDATVAAPESESTAVAPAESVDDRLPETDTPSALQALTQAEDVAPEKVSALAEEEHIVVIGSEAPDERHSGVDATDEDEPPCADSMSDGEAQVAGPEQAAAPAKDARSDNGTVDGEDAAQIDAALAVKDNVIDSLENIVKENRDRWANFEAEREQLDTRIAQLEDELRIANQIIEGSGDSGDKNGLERPQVLSRA